MSLQIQHLSKIYEYEQEQNILFTDLSIDFPLTGMIAITGDSGCGKSTLLNIIAGLEKNYDGLVTINQKNILEIKDYQKEYISFIYQNYLLIEHMSVYDNCILYNRIKGIAYSEKDVDDYLEKFSLLEYKTQNVEALSGGQKQRVAIIRACLCQSPILLCDEPTGALDQQQKKNVYDILKDISKKRLVIIVSHDPLIKRYTNQIIDFQCLKKHYSYGHYYNRYILHRKKKNYYLFKEYIHTLYHQRSKLLMIFLSQLFIVLFTFIMITSVTGIKEGYKIKQSQAINNNMIMIQKSNQDAFLDEDILKLNGMRYYRISVGQIKGIDDYQSATIQKDLLKDEIIINETMMKQINSHNLHYSLNNQEYLLKVKEIIQDDSSQPMIYFNAQTLDDRIKMQTVDLSMCIVYLESYKDVCKYLKDLDPIYDGISTVQEEYDHYNDLIDFCAKVAGIFVCIAIMIAIVLMFYIIEAMLIDMSNEFTLYYVNGMTKRKRKVFLFSIIIGICLFSTLLSSFISGILIYIVNIMKLPNLIFGISYKLTYPILIYSTFDIYLFTIVVYIIIGYIIYFLTGMYMKKMNYIENMRGD